MTNVISYERFCAARKAKIEKAETLEVELDWIDAHEAIAAARDFYAEKEREEQRFDYE